MPITSGDLQSASERVSSSTTSYARGGGGTSSTDANWAAQQSRIARALAADTDLVLYFVYLVSNRACAQAQLVAAKLSELTTLVEGWKYPEQAVLQPVRLQKLLSTLDARTSLGDEDVSRIESEVATYTRQELAPQISRKGRNQPRGQEAASKYVVARARLETDWRKLRMVLSSTIATRRFTQERVRTVALQVPLEALRTTARLLDPAQLTDFAVQLNSATAAVAALGRPLDLKTRLRTGPDAFPENCAVSSGTTPVSTLTTTPAPLRLGVKSGDLVRSRDDSTVVSAVGATALTLAEAITLVDPVEVLSGPYVAWDALGGTLEPLLGVLPAQSALVQALQAREGDRSAARIRSVMEFTVQLATILDAPSAAATEALARVGGVAYQLQGASVATQLRAFAPTFGASTRQAGDRLLQDLEAQGFDYAVEMLYAGQVDDLFDATAAQASRVGRVTEISSTIGTYTGGARGVG